MIGMQEYIFCLFKVSNIVSRLGFHLSRFTPFSIIPPEYSHLRIKELYLWESTNDVRDVQSGTSIAYADLEPKKMRQNETYDPAMKTTPIQTGEIERGNFMRMDSNRFTWDANLGTVHVKNLKQDRYYAVSYRVEGASDATELDDEYYGTLQQ